MVPDGVCRRHDWRPDLVTPLLIEDLCHAIGVSVFPNVHEVGVAKASGTHDLNRHLNASFSFGLRQRGRSATTTTTEQAATGLGLVVLLTFDHVPCRLTFAA